LSLLGISSNKNIAAQDQKVLKSVIIIFKSGGDRGLVKT